MFVQIYKLGEGSALYTFPQGRHELGRGPILQCNDKRVSRNHAIIEITENEVKLTSMHINPCFVRLANSKTITILKKDLSSTLSTGDAFALLPDNFWFKIKIVEDANLDIPKIEVTDTEAIVKRQAESSDETIPAKRNKNEETIDNDATIQENGEPEKHVLSEAIAKRQAESSNEAIPAKRNKNEETMDNDATSQKNDEQKEEDMLSLTPNSVSIKEEDGETVEDAAPVEEVPQNVEATSSQTDDGNIDELKYVKNVPEESVDGPTSGQNNLNDADEGTSAGSSNVKPRRERCWYGAQCYRKNPVHRNEYTHPGDSDYDSDPNDNRPTCSFGAECYRKNKDHRRNYRHPSNQPPTKQKRKRTKTKRLNAADSEEMRELDLSDSEEDPFINDDDSDVYSANSISDYSDWEESQDVDEDGENVKRLVKEAKQFTKK